MAGHSKWANIKHAKARQDAKRGKVFTKLIREITVAAQLGGEDLNSNPRLRTAVDKAFSANMTKDTIQRAIKRGAGTDNESRLMEIRYEGYAPYGIAVIVDCLTDNKNRTVGEVRHIFSKYGGNLGTTGSVAYLFHPRGLITFAPPAEEEKIMEIGAEANAQDVIFNSDGSVDLITSVEAFDHTLNSLKTAGLHPESAESTLLPEIEMALNKEQADEVLHLIEMLEDLDDVQRVYSNASYEEKTH